MVYQGRVRTDNIPQTDTAAPDTTVAEVNGTGKAAPGENEVEQAVEGTICPLPPQLPLLGLVTKSRDPTRRTLDCLANTAQMLPSL